MASFTNFATLSYNGGTTNSNTVTGELLETLTVTKTAVVKNYAANDKITYIISIVNSGAQPVTNLTVTDNLGAYEFNSGTVYPLAYVSNSVRYYVNGVLQTAPTATPEPKPTPNAADLDGFGYVERPEEYLPEYEVQYVKSSGGYAIFLSSDVNRTQHFDQVLDATEVRVIARQGKSALIIVNDGRVGWATASMLEDAPTALYCPGHKDLADFPDVESPPHGWLPAYETYYVKSTAGAGIYITNDLAREEVSRLLKDGTEVTALAREGTYMILIKGDGFAGWADIDLLTSEKPADS